MPVSGYCGACKVSWPLDLPKIVERRGPYWTLVGRKLRCIHCRRDATMMAKGWGGFTWPIGGEEAATYTAVKVQRRRCVWCNKASHE